MSKIFIFQSVRAGLQRPPRSSPARSLRDKDLDVKYFDFNHLQTDTAATPPIPSRSLKNRGLASIPVGITGSPHSGMPDAGADCGKSHENCC
jgi:hypothetical protein